MDTRIIEVRKNILIRRTLTAEDEFNWTINDVNFVPDEVIVKSVMYLSSVNENPISSIYTDLVSDVICSFFDNIQLSPDIKFTLQKPISGQYRFQFVPAEESPPNVTTRSGDLFIHLEFVKYRTKLPEKKVF